MANQDEKRGWPAADAKWTNKVGRGGYSVIPNILFWYGAYLGMTPPQQATLFQLVSRWWSGDSTPTISKARMAGGLGITESQVQRHLSALKKLGLIETRYPKQPGRHPYEYTFEGLVAKLEKVAVAYESEKRQQQHGRGKAVRAVTRKTDKSGKASR